MKLRLCFALATALLFSACEPILLKVATQDEVAAYKASSNGQVAAPVFSLAPGSYSSDARMTLSSDSAGASLRYTTDGSDPTSSGNGTLYTGPFALPANTQSTLKAVAFREGWQDSSIASGTYISFPTGAIDTSFGGGGTGYFRDGSLIETVLAVGVQSDGRIVFAGEDRHAGIGITGIVTSRLNANGTDANAGSGGYRELSGSAARALVVLPDDRVVVAGMLANNATLFRMASNNMTTNGTVSISEAFLFTALARQPNGAVVAVGIDGSTPAKLVVARFTVETSLALDTSFNAGGATPGVFVTGLEITPAAVFVLSSGALKVVGLGSSGVGNSNNAVTTVQITGGGALDTTYGAAGVASVILPQYGFFTVKNGFASVTAALLQPDGKVVFAGNPVSIAGLDHPWLLGRLLTDGTMDTSFGSPGAGGFQMYPLPAAFSPGSFDSQTDTPKALALSSTGKILVAGTTRYLDSDGTTLLGLQLNLARFTSEGRLDLTYNVGTPYAGLSLSHAGFTAVSGRSDDWAALAFQQDGRLVVAGAAEPVMNFARYW